MSANSDSPKSGWAVDWRSLGLRGHPDPMDGARDKNKQANRYAATAECIGTVAHSVQYLALAEQQSPAQILHAHSV